MGRPDSGVARYVFASATVRVGFPVDFRGNVSISCYQCPFYQRNYRSCGLNKRIVAYPEHYVGDECPLEIEKETDEYEKDQLG